MPFWCHLFEPQPYWTIRPPTRRFVRGASMETSARSRSRATLAPNFPTTVAACVSNEWNRQGAAEPPPNKKKKTKKKRRSEPPPPKKKKERKVTPPPQPTEIMRGTYRSVDFTFAGQSPTCSYFSPALPTPHSVEDPQTGWIRIHPLRLHVSVATVKARNDQDNQFINNQICLN